MNYSNMSNTLILKLNKSVNKHIFVQSIVKNTYNHLVLVDPGDILLYLNKKEEKILRYLIKNKEKDSKFYFYNFFFRQLFKFSSSVIKIFHQYNVYHMINNQKIRTLGIHIRLGKYGDFHEKNATYFANMKCLSYFNYTIKNIIRKYDIQLIILSSDSSYITNQNISNLIIVRNIFKYKILQHSNKWYFNSLNDDSIECLLEMYMLSKSKYLVLTKNSAFSKVAYFMNKNCDKESCKIL